MFSLFHTSFYLFFFFNDTATTEIYTLSLHDALPISSWSPNASRIRSTWTSGPGFLRRSEEHTSELQSLTNLVCRLLLEKKKTIAATESSCECMQRRSTTCMSAHMGVSASYAATSVVL